MTEPSAPFANEDEYRTYRDLRDNKEADIHAWVKSTLKTIYPSDNMSIDEVFETRDDMLAINYWHKGTDWQELIPVACMWSNDCEALIKEYRENLREQAAKKEREQAKQEKIDVEAEERKLLVELTKKYGSP